MNTVVIDKKSYVVVPRKENKDSLMKTTRKNIQVKKLSLLQGKKYADKLIDKWAKEK